LFSTLFILTELYSSVKKICKFTCCGGDALVIAEQCFVWDWVKKEMLLHHPVKLNRNFSQKN